MDRTPATPATVQKLANRALVVYRTWVLDRAAGKDIPEDVVVAAVQPYAVAAGISVNDAMKGTLEAYDRYYARAGRA